MEKTVIELRSLSKFYGSVKAVDHLDLKINKGEVFGLLGPNGAGKTTTILMMLGLAEPSAGQALVGGINATQNPIAVKRKVGYMPDSVGFYEGMTALDNLKYVARLNGILEEEVEDRAVRVMEMVGLGKDLHKKASVYSRGMKQRLGLAEVLIREPEIIILDEPTLGIDPSGIREFLQLIRQLSREHGLTVLLSSHHLHQVQQVCDRVGIFVGGKLLVEGDIDSLAKKLFDQESYVIGVDLKQSWTDTQDTRVQAAIAELKQWPVFKSIQMDGQQAEISCCEDRTSEIVRVLVQHQLDVIGVQRRSYGLDEIYERFFEENKQLEREASEKVKQSFKSYFFKKRRVNA